MSELGEDRSDLPFLSRRLIAAREIAQVEIERARSHEGATLAETANLASIEMYGEWDAADDFEGDLFAGMTELFESDRHTGGRLYTTMRRIRRIEPEAKIAITIPAGLTSEHGYVALRRSRLFMTMTAPELAPLEIDKISMFALDIAKLADLSPHVARDVRLIVAQTMYLAIDQTMLSNHEFQIRAGDRRLFERVGSSMGVSQADDAFLEALGHYNRFHDSIARYGMTVEEVEHGLYKKEPARLHDPESLQLIEDALHTRSELLTPAATTYYVHS